MAEAISHTCDVCGKAKQGSNHWFRAAIIRERAAPGSTDQRVRLLIGRWDDVADFPAPHFHLCGAACLAKKTSAFAGGDISGPGEKAATA